MFRLATELRAIAARRVRIACALKGLAGGVPPGLPGDRPPPGAESGEGARLGLPALIDRHPALSQSLAIIEHLDESCPYPPLLPAEPAARARVRTIAAELACELHPVNNRRVQDFLRRAAGDGVAQQLAWYRHWLERGLLAVESRLAASGSRGRFCENDHPSLADCCLRAHLEAACAAGCPLEHLPTLMQIDAECRTLPAFAPDDERTLRKP